ncbi:unnamed protein product [Rotaria sp. Silwood2]|nr:unnamed protein product [Rotaria sp. Silwood2]CAF4405272.1 unnamed protein product [Rotaria sp. Silwood2]
MCQSQGHGCARLAIRLDKEPSSLSLLRNDHSKLASNEWTLLSNCLHTFDEQNVPIKIQYCINEFSSLPPKLRMKPSEVANLIRALYSGVGAMVEQSPDFYSLSGDTRQVLTKHNLYISGVMNSFFLSRELNIFDNLSVLNVCNHMYGSEYVLKLRGNVARYDSNGSLIKILIFILTFSSNISIVQYDNEEHISIMSNSINLVRIQNIYVTMLWKYLVYLYGFNEAVLRFTSLVKNVLDLLSFLNSVPEDEARQRMMNKIVTETERTLVITD